MKNSKPQCSSIIPCLMFAFIAAWLFVSCAGLPKAAVSARSVAEWTPQWKPLAGGIDLTTGIIENPMLKFWALRVDLKDESLEIVANTGKKNSGTVISTKVTSFLMDYGCTAAINAGVFSPVTNTEGENRTIIGVFVSNGVMISPPDPRYDALVFYKDGSAAILGQAALAEGASSVKTAFGGFNAVLRAGEPFQAARTDFGKQRNPRSAAGLAGNILYLLAIDGRRPSSVGATLNEVGLLLAALGAKDGINLDGGGSTALAVLENGKPRLLNKPSGNLITAGERAVATCIGIRLKNSDSH